MSKIFNKILNSGVSFAQGNSLLEKKYVLTNLICLILGISTLPFIFVFYSIGGPKFGLMTLVNDLVFFLGIYLNSRGKINLSRNLVLIFWSVGVLGYTLLLGKETSLQNCFFSIIAVPFIMFTPKENKAKYWHLVFPFLAYFLVEFDVFGVSQEAFLSRDLAHQLRNIINPTVLIQIVLVVYYYGIQERVLLEEIEVNRQLNASLKKESNVLKYSARKIERSELNLKSLLKSIDDIVIEVNSAGTVLNSWTSEEFTLTNGTNVGDYFGQFMQVKVEGAFTQFKGDYFNKVHEYKYDGFYYQFKITPVHHLDGEEETAVLTIRDITLNKQLSEEYGEIKKEKEVAQKSAEFKELFLANMSHEIRTPLNGVVGMIDLLKATDINEVQRDYIETLGASSDNLLTIINDILDLSKIQAGKMSIIPKVNNLHVLLKNAGELFVPMAKSKGLELKVEIGKDVPTYSKFDATRLTQVLSNLISNAVKFTLEGKVTIRAKKDDKGILFEIEDTGGGISREDQRALFEDFSQLNDDNAPVKGTGLGLSIVSKLLVLMDSEINLASVVGKGTVFYFSLPLEEAVEPKRKIVENENKVGLDGLQFLLVDDIFVNRKVARAMLEKMGGSVLEAKNGAESITTVESQQFDVILMDVQMPVMDGITAMKKIKELGIKTPIIALSANAMEGDKEQYLSEGFDGYMSKPITFGKLKSGINAAL